MSSCIFDYMFTQESKMRKDWLLAEIVPLGNNYMKEFSEHNIALYSQKPHTSGP